MTARTAMAPTVPAPLAPDWRAQEILLLSQVVRGVGQNLAPALVLREMLHLMSELLGLNGGRVVLAESAGAGPAASAIQHAYGLTKEEAARGRYALGEGVTGRVLDSGQATIVQDVDAEPAFLFRAVPRNRLPLGTVAFIALPIQVDGRTIGVLACHRMRLRNRQLSDDVAILRILATLAGQVLRRQRCAAATLPVTLSAPQDRLASPVRDYWPADSHPAQALTEALARHRGNQSRAAQSLGLTPRQFGYRLRKLGVQVA